METTSPSVSQSLFQAVAERDYNALAILYAVDARDAVLSFLSMRSRWQMRQQHAVPVNDEDDNDAGDRAEEKMDEFLQQLAYQEATAVARSSSSSLPFGRSARSSSAEDASYYALLREIAVFLAEQKQRQNEYEERQQQQQQQREVNEEEYAMDICSSDGDDNEVKDKPSSPSAPSSSSLKARGGNKLELSVDAARLLRGTSAILSDTRPPPNFVVYEDGFLSVTPAATGGVPTAAAAAVTDRPGPPLFDGGVANATPPPLGGGVGGAASGGAGTILHLACALDVPLALAFLLAMGADARASHTAFRRLMIHEAACNGSIQCLQLLLELGHRYNNGDVKQQPQSSSQQTPASATVAKQQHQHQQQQQQPSNNNSPPHRSHREHIMCSLPFLPRRSAASATPQQEGAAAAAAASLPLQFYQNSRPASLLFARHKAAHSKPSSSQSSEQRSFDFLQLLRLFRDFASEVRAGNLTELEAARRLLDRTSLADLSKACLARSCAFSTGASHHQQWNHHHRHLLTRPLYPPAGGVGGPAVGTAGGASSDGHGNTPLHWAAFKNETACVDLLLRYRADPNARAHPSGWTPLHDAAYSNSSESIALLLDAGAHVDARANSGATPLCFAAQEDAAEAAALLLRRGADLRTRCAGTNGSSNGDGHQNQHGNPAPHSRFSGYTPLHYCAHYNAHRAARVLLQDEAAAEAMDIPDLSDRLAIHVAVARGSADVLRELLHAGARVQTRLRNRRSRKKKQGKSRGEGSRGSDGGGEPTPRRRRFRRYNDGGEPGPGNQRSAAPSSPRGVTAVESAASAPTVQQQPPSPERRLHPAQPHPVTPGRSRSSSSSSSSSVSSPVLRSMIPQQPVQSSKPWNCLSQRSIDECRQLISEAELHWTAERHGIFTPADRRAVQELLLVGKRLERVGVGLHVYDLWPYVLSFCGRGWFEQDESETSVSSSTDEDSIVVVEMASPPPVAAASLVASQEEEESANDEDLLLQDADFMGESSAQDDDHLALPSF